MRATAENTKAVSLQVTRLRSIEAFNDAQLEELTNEAIKRFPEPKTVQRAIDAIVSEWDHVPRPYDLGRLAKGSGA